MAADQPTEPTNGDLGTSDIPSMGPSSSHGLSDAAAFQKLCRLLAKNTSAQESFPLVEVAKSFSAARELLKFHLGRGFTPAPLCMFFVASSSESPPLCDSSKADTSHLTEYMRISLSTWESRHRIQIGMNPNGGAFRPSAFIRSDPSSDAVVSIWREKYNCPQPNDNPSNKRGTTFYGYLLKDETLLMGVLVPNTNQYSDMLKSTSRFKDGEEWLRSLPRKPLHPYDLQQQVWEQRNTVENLTERVARLEDNFTTHFGNDVLADDAEPSHPNILDRSPSPDTNPSQPTILDRSSDAKRSHPDSPHSPEHDPKHPRTHDIGYRLRYLQGRTSFGHFPTPDQSDEDQTGLIVSQIFISDHLGKYQSVCVPAPYSGTVLTHVLSNEKMAFGNVIGDPCGDLNHIGVSKLAAQLGWIPVRVSGQPTNEMMCQKKPWYVVIDESNPGYGKIVDANDLCQLPKSIFHQPIGVITRWESGRPDGELPEPKGNWSWVQIKVPFTGKPCPEPEDSAAVLRERDETLQQRIATLASNIKECGPAAAQDAGWTEYGRFFSCMTNALTSPDPDSSMAPDGACSSTHVLTQDLSSSQPSEITSFRIRNRKPPVKLGELMHVKLHIDNREAEQSDTCSQEFFPGYKRNADRHLICSRFVPRRGRLGWYHLYSRGVVKVRVPSDWSFTALPQPERGLLYIVANRKGSPLASLMWERAERDVPKSKQVRPVFVLGVCLRPLSDLECKLLTPYQITSPSIGDEECIPVLAYIFPSRDVFEYSQPKKSLIVELYGEFQRSCVDDSLRFDFFRDIFVQLVRRSMQLPFMTAIPLLESRLNSGQLAPPDPSRCKLIFSMIKMPHSDPQRLLDHLGRCDQLQPVLFTLLVSLEQYLEESVYTFFLGSAETFSKFLDAIEPHSVDSLVLEMFLRVIGALLRLARKQATSRKSRTYFFQTPSEIPIASVLHRVLDVISSLIAAQHHQITRLAKHFAWIHCHFVQLVSVVNLQLLTVAADQIVPLAMKLMPVLRSRIPSINRRSLLEEYVRCLDVLRQCKLSDLLHEQIEITLESHIIDMY
jgi:hypothetical protein